MTDEQTDSKKLLNPLQRERLTTTLGTLEEMLCEVERNLTLGGCKGILHEMRDDIPEPIQEEFLQRISLIRERIAAMAEQFGLEKTSRDTSRDVMGKLAYGWEILTGAKAGHLRGGGMVAEGLAEVLDPQLGGIIALVNEMQNLIVTAEKPRI